MTPSGIRVWLILWMVQLKAFCCNSRDLLLDQLTAPENHDVSLPFFLQNVKTNHRHDKYWKQFTPDDWEEDNYWQFKGEYNFHLRHDSPVIDFNILSKQTEIKLQCYNHYNEDIYQMCFSNDTIADMLSVFFCFIILCLYA